MLWLPVILVGFTSLAVFATMRGLRTALDVGPRTRRLRLRRFLRAGGWWELSVATALITMHQWTSVVPIFGLGLLLLWYSRMWAKNPWMGR
jgi:hypothetical protein